MKKEKEPMPEIDESLLTPEQYEEEHRSHWSWPWFWFFVVMGLVIIGLVVTILLL